MKLIRVHEYAIHEVKFVLFVPRDYVRSDVIMLVELLKKNDNDRVKQLTQTSVGSVRRLLRGPTVRK